MTLVQFWTQQRDLYKNKKAALTTALNTQQADLTKAQTDGLKKAQDAIAANDASIAEKRAALATSTIPAEAQALVLEIRDLQIKQRIAIGNLLDQQEIVNALQTQLDSGNDQLQRLTTRLADAEAQLASAGEAQKRRDKLKERVTTSPVKDVPAQANTAKTGPEHTDASNKIDDLPAELLGLARKRFDVRVARLTNADTQARAAEDEWVTQREAWGGDGKLEQERTAFVRAEQAVQAFASSALPEYERALTILKSIAAADLLTKSESDALPTTAARTNAAGNADTVADDLTAIDAARLDLENTQFTKLAADPDIDLSADATVTAKKLTVTNAEKALKDDTTTNYPDKQVTDQWQAIVTDKAWRAVVDFYEAEATLARVAGLSGAALVTDMDNKEAAYAAALADLIKARRRLEYVEDAAAQQKRRSADLTASRALRLLSAVRGDSF